MVRAGVVEHPAQWVACGYREVQDPPKRYGIIDLPVLMELLDFSDLAQLQRTRAQWVEEALGEVQGRESNWSESLAIGSQAFVEGVKTRLGINARYRKLSQEGKRHSLKEPAIPYSIYIRPKNDTLSDDNAIDSD